MYANSVATDLIPDDVAYGFNRDGSGYCFYGREQLNFKKYNDPKHRRKRKRAVYEDDEGDTDPMWAPGNWVCSYESLHRFMDEFGKMRNTFDLIVCDEITSIARL